MSRRSVAWAALGVVLLGTAGAVALWRRPEAAASLPVARLPDCADPVGVAWGEEDERLGCLSELEALLAGAGAAAGCAAPDPGTVDLARGERVRITAGDDGRCTHRVEPLPGSALRLLGLPVNLNLARVEDLAALPGIGPERARRIVASRERDGPFGSAADLERVSGIGPATVESLRGAVTVERGGGR